MPTGPVAGYEAVRELAAISQDITVSDGWGTRFDKLKSAAHVPALKGIYADHWLARQLLAPGCPSVSRRWWRVVLVRAPPALGPGRESRASLCGLDAGSNHQLQLAVNDFGGQL